MNWEVLTKWYTLLPAALSVGPVFSLLGIDGFIHKTILNNGGGKRLIEKNEITRTINSVVVGSPFWIAVSSIFLQPFWGGGFPVKYVTLLLAGGLLKLLYGRSYIYDTNVEDSSTWWDPIWRRKPDNLWDEIGRMFTKFAYPSVHTLAVAGAVLFGVHSPAAWVLLAAVVTWLILAHHHWTSDVVSAAMLVAAAVDLLK
jgi:hypothetical protein